MSAKQVFIGLLAFGGTGTVLNGAFLLFHCAGKLTPYMFALCSFLTLFTLVVYWVVKDVLFTKRVDSDS